MAPGRPLAVAPPAAHRYRAAEGTASKGSMMFGGPGSPKAVIPHSCQVEGRNCIGPRAPAVDTPGLARSPLSIWPMAPSTVQGSPGQYMTADPLNNLTQAAGPSPPLAGTG